MEAWRKPETPREIPRPGASRRRPDHAQPVYPDSGAGAGAGVGAPLPAPARADHFAEHDGQVFAGTHVLLDLWGARHLDDADHIERAMRRAVDVSGATLLHIHLHRFGDGGGVTGVAVLAESHISVHTWPERGFAAFDVFMCGRCRPDLAAEALRSALDPVRTEISVERRGVVA
jgi:S-adenosylmethionine decarboxylase